MRMSKYIQMSLAILVALSISCAMKTPAEDSANKPDEEVIRTYQQQEETAETTVSETEEPDVEQEDNSALETFVQQVIDEAALLRTDGQRMVDDGDLEEARGNLDEALNVILNSGLALDAHPELATLFKDITRDVVHIENEIADAENGIDENILINELETMELEEVDGEELESQTTVTFDLPVVHNSVVQQFIDRFQGPNREAIAAGIQRSGQFIERFREILKEEGVPQDLVYLAMIESTFKVRAYSRASAKGIWQFMSWTGKRYGLRIDWWVDERSDPYKACRSAARYLKDLHAELGDWLLAMAAYNGGPGRVGRAIKRYGTRDFWELTRYGRTYIRRETRNFVPSILAVALIMKEPAKYGFDNITLDEPWKFDEVNIANPVDLRIVAELANVDVSEIQALNPALRQLITPDSYSDFMLRLPVGKSQGLSDKLAALPKDKRLKYTEYFVKRGDTLSVIARRHGSSVTAIQQANNISNPRRIKPGMHLVIPLSAGYQHPTTYASSSYTKGQKITHTVSRGESLYRIARRYGTTVGSIANWNSLDPRRTIHPGNRLTIYARQVVQGTSGGTTVSTPSGSSITYSVKQGDTLYDIAIKYKTTVTNLKRWNNLNRNLIKPGDRLTVYLNGNDSN